MLDGKRVLAVHASIQDEYWKAIAPGELYGEYPEYDYVFSGHSHKPHFFEVYYDDPGSPYREKHKTTFINPGSVGQPRNHNPNACYAIVDMENGSVLFREVDYDVESAMALYNGQVDMFYRDRLRLGV